MVQQFPGPKNSTLGDMWKGHNEKFLNLSKVSGLTHNSPKYVFKIEDLSQYTHLVTNDNYCLYQFKVDYGHIYLNGNISASKEVNREL